MRKINMKRKGRKEKPEQQKSEEENGVEDDKPDDPKTSSEEEAASSDSEPETKKKKSDKRKSVSFSNKKSKKETADEDPQYEVEEVLEEKMVKGVRHYLIRWKGYEPESDSWEPESTLDCAELIKKFKASLDDKDKSDTNSSDSPKKGKKNIKKVKKSTPKKKKAKPEDDDDEADWDSGDEFEVDRILDVYFKRNGKREFLVSWKGYPSSQDSWEPEENLECLDLISKFMSKVKAAKNVQQKELRVNRSKTERFTLNMYSGDGSRRLSRRLSGKQRVQYHDAD